MRARTLLVLLVAVVLAGGTAFLARAWLAENLPPRYRSIRFDVVGVSLDAGGGSVVEHLPGAF